MQELVQAVLWTSPWRRPVVLILIWGKNFKLNIKLHAVSRLEVRDLLVEENMAAGKFSLTNFAITISSGVYPGVSAAGVASPVSIVFGPHPDMT